MDIEQFKRYVARMNPKLDDLNRYIQTHATLSKEDLEELVACIDKQAVQIGELQQEIATRNDTMNATVEELVSAQDEIQRLKNITTIDISTIQRVVEVIQTDDAVTDTLWFDDYSTVVDTLNAMIPSKTSIERAGQ